MGFIDTIREHPITSTTLFAARSTYAWVSENLWPVYSVGAIVSVVCMLAASQEKQTLADHLYGNNKAFVADQTTIVSSASKHMDDEISFAIKQDVFSMPRQQFLAENEARR